MVDISFFTPEIRAQRYRRFAVEAREKAASATGATHFHYLLLADDWDVFAAELEESLEADGCYPASPLQTAHEAL